jgi:mono/diheme cytochrome c family protein
MVNVPTRIFLITVLGLSLSACEPSLERQPKIHPLEAPQSPPEGVQAFSATTKGMPRIDRSLIERGRERYQIYCSVCHGLDGQGDGIATQRGFGRPSPFSNDLINVPAGKIETLIANGKDRMLGFANRIPFQERIAIAIYVQVLALRRHFPRAFLSQEDRKYLEGLRK